MLTTLAHYRLPAILILILLLLLLRQLKPKSDKEVENIFRQLPSNQIEETESFYLQLLSLFQVEREFQRKTKGWRGDLTRTRTTDIYLELIWQTHRRGKISSADAAYIWTWAILQLLCTIVALPERLLCFLIAPIPHVFSFLAYAAHRRIVLRCEVAFARIDAPECLLRLRDLLYN